MALNETEMANIIYDSPLSFPMGHDIPEAFIKILTLENEEGTLIKIFFSS